MEEFRAFTLLETSVDPDCNLLRIYQADTWNEILYSKTGGFLRNEQRQWNPPSMSTEARADFHQMFVDRLSPEVELAISHLLIAPPARMHLLFSMTVLPKKKRDLLKILSHNAPLHVIEVTKDDNPEILFPGIADEILEELGA